MQKSGQAQAALSGPVWSSWLLVAEAPVVSTAVGKQTALATG